MGIDVIFFAHTWHVLRSLWLGDVYGLSASAPLDKTQDVAATIPDQIPPQTDDGQILVESPRYRPDCQSVGAKAQQVGCLLAGKEVVHRGTGGATDYATDRWIGIHGYSVDAVPIERDASSMGYRVRI